MTDNIFISSSEKNEIFYREIEEKLNFHKKKSIIFKKILNELFPKKNYDRNIKNLPFLPINLFKKYELLSIPKNNVTKIMSSSGTTSSNKSKIFLDKENALLQTKVLLDIGKFFLPFKKGNMLILEQENNTLDKSNFNARAAGIFGFSAFAKNIIYCIDKANNFNLETKRLTNNDFIFGFTDTTWEFLNNFDNNRASMFKDMTLVHGGGWKKLQHLNINKKTFINTLYKKFKFQKIINYYGMIEQTGSIFFECTKGYFHTSKFNDIIIRGEYLKPLKNKELGLIQLLSTLPKSYPGNSILTEDLGIIHGEDDCACGNFGKYFTVEGRVLNSEVRGCSNV